MKIGSALFSALAVAVFLLAWKLSQGPISLPQLTPYITKAVAQNARGITMRLEDTTLSWEGWDRILDLRIRNASFFTRDGRRFAHIPEAAISLSSAALIQGVVAPQTIEVIEPTIQILRHGDGMLALELGDGMRVRADQAFDLESLLGQAPTLDNPLSYLEKIQITQGHFDYEDKANDIMLHAPQVDMGVQRIGETLVFESDLDFAIDDKRTALRLEVDYNLTTDLLETRAALHAIPIDALAKVSAEPALSPLAGMDVSLFGSVDVLMDRQGKVRSFYADLGAGEGRLRLPDPVAQVLALDSAAIKVGYEDFNGIVRLEDANVALKAGSHFQLTTPAPHAFPLEALTVNGSFDVLTQDYDLETFVLETGTGMQLSAKAQGSVLTADGQRTLGLQAVLSDVDVALLGDYWPAGVVPNARAWVIDHIRTGAVPRASVDLALSASEQWDNISVGHVKGDIDIARADVDYLPPLTAVDGAAGYAEFDHEEFRIHINKGTAGPIDVDQGKVVISGLSAANQYLALDLDLTGRLPDKLAFIDQEPLGFASALGFDPQKTQGAVFTHLAMNFPLINTLGWDQVALKATAQSTDVAIEQAVLGQDISNGDVRLSVTPEGLDLEGRLRFGSIDADVTWRENFSAQSVFKRRFLMTAEQVNQDQRRNELRLDFPPFNADIITGDMPLRAVIVEEWSGQGGVDVFADLTSTQLDIPILHWKKDDAIAAQAYAKIVYNTQRLIGVPYFTVTSDGLEVIGSIGLDPTGAQLQVVNLDRFYAGQTQIDQGTVLFSPEAGWEVDVTGQRLDLTRALSKMRERRHHTGEVPSTTEATGTGTGVQGTFSGRFQTVYLDQDYPLKDVVGAIASDGDIWSQAHMTGTVGGGAPFSIDISPEQGTLPPNRRVVMTAQDAGGLLRSLDLFDDMQDGALQISGVINDQAAGRPLVGRIEVDDYRIVEVPSLAKVLSLAALTGILDSLQGEGIGFSNLDAPFKMEKGVIEFKDGLTSGLSLGLTWQGTLDTDQNRANLVGTIVPAYAVNSLLGNVPLIGDLFTAGERGGGLFAWTFDVQGDLDDPEVSVNAASGLAPGVLRRLFQSDEVPQ